jgi:hypothetical protein
MDPHQLFLPKRRNGMFGQKAKIFVLVFATALVTACSSSGVMTIKQPLIEKIPRQKSVSLSVAIDTAEHQKEEDYIEVSKRIRDSLYTKLVTEGIFKSVFLAPEPADYGMDVTITSARMVSGLARVWWGVMAGHNDAQMTVRVNNLASNQVVADFEVDGTSASHPFSSESNPDDAIREAVNQIIKGLK